MKEKRYIIRKYIMAKSAKNAIKLDKTKPVDDVFVDQDWMSENTKTEMGFKK